MAKISLPASFQKWTDGNSQVQLGGENVSEVILELEKKYPELKNKIVSEKRTPLRFVKIFVNGEEIGQLEGLGTQLNKSDKVKIILALAGG